MFLFLNTGHNVTTVYRNNQNQRI